MVRKLLTVFTPTYNRADTLKRTYKSLCNQTCKDFEWLIIDDGSSDNTKQVVNNWINEGKIPIRYIYKQNGGLHTGYNEAIMNINTELNICIDSDDYMPVNAVEIIKRTWESKKSEDLAGIIGLDFLADTNVPVGGYFSDVSNTIHFLHINSKLKHYGDVKMVLRTELVKPFIPMKSFPGEKNFNPIYLYYKIDSRYKYLLINENLCYVDYQLDGMSAGIFKQYINSPRSFAEIRYCELSHPLVSRRRKYISAAHLISSSLIAGDWEIVKKSPKKFLTLVASPLGLLLYLYIKYKAKK